MRVALVHDWLDTWRGGEAVLAQMTSLWPDATLFCLVDFLDPADRERMGGRRAITSFLQRVPAAPRLFRYLLPLMPLAVESLDLGGFDLVVSSSHAVAKGARVAPGQVHLCYCHTPMRYAWDLRESYFDALGWGSGPRRWIAERLLDRLREWDRRTSGRVHAFACNSAHVRERIRRCYGREATVIHPPVDVAFFTPGEGPRGDHYVTGSHFAPYKRIDLVVEAFRALPDRRLVVFGDGPGATRLRARAGRNVTFTGQVPRATVRDLLRAARAFVFAGEEDFGIVLAEALACGTPVIAYGRGGASEIVRPLGSPGATGLLFPRQSADAVAESIRRFEGAPGAIDRAECARSARRFGSDRFRAELADFVARESSPHAAARPR